MNDLEKMQRLQQRLEACIGELHGAQKEYAGLLETVPDALIFINKDGRIVLVNARLERMFGYRREELIGEGIEILVPEPDRAGKSVLSYCSNPGTRPMGAGLEIRGRKKDGTEFPAEISLFPIEINREPVAAGTVRDITERKHIERQIEENYFIQKVISSVLKISLEPVPLEEQLDRILDLILTIPGIALQPMGSIYLVEEEPEVLVLKTERRLRGTGTFCAKIPFGKCLCGKAASERTIIFAERIDDRHEIRYPGELPHGHYCVPIVSGGEVLGLINLLVKEGHRSTPEEKEFLFSIAETLAGIIERHRAEKEKLKLIEQVAQSEKMAALGRITAGVAHEIRNPLTAIGGFTRRLHKKFADGTKEKEYTGFIISEVLRLENILHDVLSFSRGVTPHMEECNIHEILEEALKIFQESCLEQSIAINRSFGDIPLMKADRELALEAIENLVSNAVEAMPDGGTLTVTTGREVIAGAAYATVKVADTGPGIKEKDLAMIFEPFFTTKLGSKKTGLGLSITKKIMEDHGGFVRVESKPGEGAVFSLYFPSAPKP
ncbi:MAG: PAS domain S-box protein [Nitrospiraceae bacterium]|nr:PAS domain S-box protein [Nitrospiraceae bacterium]